MDKSIKIISGKRGWHLMVNGLYISQAFGGDIKAIKNNTGIPYGATEWVSIKAIREFWHKYMHIVLHSVSKPYTSTWGKLQCIA